MADYRTIADAEVDPDAPLTSSLGYAWRDNPIAIAEGATGAPRVQDGALDTNVTGAGSAWVFNRIINRGAGGIGQTVMARHGSSPGVAIALGDTVSGGSIVPSNASGDPVAGGGSLSGTWRCMGAISGGAVVGAATTTIWQRIS